jgi:hypothetical protein
MTAIVASHEMRGELPANQANAVELTIPMPRLNEAQALGFCIADGRASCTAEDKQISAF